MRSQPVVLSEVRGQYRQVWHVKPPVEHSYYRVLSDTWSSDLSPLPERHIFEWEYASPLTEPTELTT